MDRQFLCSDIIVYISSYQNNSLSRYLIACPNLGDHRFMYICSTKCGIAGRSNAAVTESIGKVNTENERTQFVDTYESGEFDGAAVSMDHDLISYLHVVAEYV